MVDRPQLETVAATISVKDITAMARHLKSYCDNQSAGRPSFLLFIISAQPPGPTSPQN